MKKFKSIVAILLAFIILVTPALAAEPLSGDLQFRAINSIASYLEIYYKFDTDASYLKDVAFYEKLTNPDATLEDMITAMMSTLDEHSVYLPEKDYNYLVNQSLQGEFCGIGVSIIQSGERVVVVTPIKGSPAERAGVLQNDIFATVNGEDVTGKSIEYIQSLVMGEEGTSVDIGFLRGESIVNITITREKIKNASVAYEVLDGNIGYISVSSFTLTTGEEAKAALEELNKLKVKKIIVDLRNNPGGELQSVIEFSNLFIPQGVVANIEYTIESNNKTYYSYNKGPRYKLAVLVNKGSASGSELFAAAVKDRKAGKLFGTKTYGKGTMQTVLPYPLTGGGLKITVAEFLSPSKNKINEVGVIPDYHIVNKESTRDTSHFLPYDITVINNEGNTGDNVKAIQQRLEFLGYFEGEADGNFDAKTAEAVKLYQAYNNLPITGIVNLDTALSLNNIDYSKIVFTDDLQLEAAIEYLNGLK